MEKNKLNEREPLLIKKLIKSDSYAFKEIFDLYGQKVFYFARKFSIPEQEAECIVQDIFLKLWECRKELEKDTSLSAFLFTLTKNKVLNLYRKRKNEMRYIMEIRNIFSQSHNQTESSIIYSDLSNLAMQQINKLPQRRKQIYYLKKIKGLSNKEISEKLNISIKTVENQMTLAIKFMTSFSDKHLQF